MREPFDSNSAWGAFFIVSWLTLGSSHPSLSPYISHSLSSVQPKKSQRQEEAYQRAWDGNGGGQIGDNTKRAAPERGGGGAPYWVCAVNEKALSEAMGREG